MLLIRRGKEPLKGRWVVPGGRVEWGETLAQAVVREIAEETGLAVVAEDQIAVVEVLGEDHHFVIVDFLCSRQGGTVEAGSDAMDAAFVPLDSLGAFDVPEKAREVIGEAVKLRSKKEGLDPRQERA